MNNVPRPPPLSSPGSKRVKELKVVRDWWRDNYCWYEKVGLSNNNKVLDIWANAVGQSVQQMISWTKTIGALEYYGIFDDDECQDMVVNKALKSKCKLGCTALNKCVKY